ncbi:MAG TPA: LuxR C-terminal-related transcriptional regulator, partial [Streptosporangiaceae bacterium]|nr:LuxR C-terminal-related transcriptional regulator [Streptosporangiaceae bacterium]
VAARMYISTHTVAHHLRQAFRKLHIASRYELTRIVIEQAADGPPHLALLVAGDSRWFRSGPSCGTASAAPGRRDGLPTRTADCGLLP